MWKKEIKKLLVEILILVLKIKRKKKNLKYTTKMEY